MESVINSENERRRSPMRSSLGVLFYTYCMLPLYILVGVQLTVHFLCKQLIAIDTAARYIRWLCPAYKSCCRRCGYLYAPEVICISRWTSPTVSICCLCICYMLANIYTWTLITNTASAKSHSACRRRAAKCVGYDDTSAESISFSLGRLLDKTWGTLCVSTARCRKSCMYTVRRYMGTATVN